MIIMLSSSFKYIDKQINIIYIIYVGVFLSVLLSAQGMRFSGLQEIKLENYSKDQQGAEEGEAHCINSDANGTSEIFF